MRCEQFVGFVLDYQADHWGRRRQCKWQILQSSDLGCYFIWVWAVFFTLAYMMLRVGFMMKIVLITHECFSCCWAVLAVRWEHFCFSPSSSARRQGLQKKMGDEKDWVKPQQTKKSQKLLESAVTSVDI